MATPASAQDPLLTESQTADYTAHEWGTFTSMVGADGGVLEGLHHEEEALPGFVHDLLSIDEYAETRVKLPASRVTQKMETPVIYFHTDEPLRVSVRVLFRKGLMTQFYPLPSEVMPQLELARAARVDLGKVETSSLLWDLDLVPHGGPLPAGIPEVAGDEPWAIARQVRAAAVRTRPQREGTRAEAEHYLFYRGLGRWQPDLQLARDGEDAIVLRNGTAGELPFVAVLEITRGGGRFVLGRPLPKGGEQRLDLGAVQRRGDRRQLAAELGDAVHKALVDSGLYQDEARAMVATWSRSWFQSDGARVIYLLPRAEVDHVLPLLLNPAPRELVRTLVGRLEFITAGRQRAVERALRQTGSADGEQRCAGEAVLADLDRFLEPHLRNVAANGSDASVRALAEQRLAALDRAWPDRPRPGSDAGAGGTAEPDPAGDRLATDGR